MTFHRVLALIAATAGLFAAASDVIPSLVEGSGRVGRAILTTRPDPSTDARDDIQAIATAIAREQDHVTALELARWIRDRKPGLRIIDLRSEEELETYRVPRSERVRIESLASMSVAPAETLVLISDGGAHAAQGWVLLRTRGIRNVFFLRGGLQEWLDDVMSPAKSNDLTEYFGGVPRGDRAPAGAAAVRRRGC